MEMLAILMGMDNSDALLNVVKEKFPGNIPYTPVKQFVTADNIAEFIPSIKPDLANNLATIFNELAPAYHLNSPAVFPAYIAECAHESQLFSTFEEHLNYSPVRLMQVWPHRFPTVVSTAPYAYNPRKLANNVYANRMGNGDEESGDGFLFRGSGPIQMTGRAMFEAYMKYKGESNVAELAQKIRTDLRTGIDSSMWVFVVNKRLLDEAEAKDIDTINRAISGGTIGQASRNALYEKALKVFA